MTDPDKLGAWIGAIGAAALAVFLSLRKAFSGWPKSVNGNGSESGEVSRQAPIVTISAVGARVGVLETELVRLRATVHDHASVLSATTMSVGHLEKRMTKIESGQAESNESMARLLAEMARLSAAIDGLKNAQADSTRTVTMLLERMMSHLDKPKA